MDGLLIRSLNEVAEERGLHPRSVANWCRKGLVLNCRKIHKTWVVVGPFIFFRSTGQREVYEVLARAVVATTSEILKQIPDVTPNTIRGQLTALEISKLIKVIGVTSTGMRILATRHDLDWLAGTPELEERIKACGAVGPKPPKQPKVTSTPKTSGNQPKGMQHLRIQADVSAVPPIMGFAQLARMYSGTNQGGQT